MRIYVLSLRPQPNCGRVVSVGGRGSRNRGLESGCDSCTYLTGETRRNERGRSRLDWMARQRRGVVPTDACHYLPMIKSIIDADGPRRRATPVNARQRGARRDVYRDPCARYGERRVNHRLSLSIPVISQLGGRALVHNLTREKNRVVVSGCGSIDRIDRGIVGRSGFELGNRCCCFYCKAQFTDQRTHSFR